METPLKSLYDKAVTVLELTKGYTPEQREAMGNLLSTMEELAGDLMIQAKELDKLRNKVIEEAIDIVTDYQDYNPLILERLNSLKTK